MKKKKPGAKKGSTRSSSRRSGGRSSRIGGFAVSNTSRLKDAGMRLVGAVVAKYAVDMAAEKANFVKDNGNIVAIGLLGLSVVGGTHDNTFVQGAAIGAGLSGIGIGAGEMAKKETKSSDGKESFYARLARIAGPGTPATDYDGTIGKYNDVDAIAEIPAEVLYPEMDQSMNGLNDFIDDDAMNGPRDEQDDEY